MENNNIKEISIDDQKVLVEQYLPLEEKVNLITSVIEQSGNGEEGFFNIVKLETYYIIEMLRAYTNISFTDKQKEDPSKLYDILYSSNVLSTVLEVIPQEEYMSITNGVKDTIEAVYKYQNSVLGILDTIKTDYSNLDLDITKLSSKLTGDENLDMVKNILTKLN